MPESANREAKAVVQEVEDRGEQVMAVAYAIARVVSRKAIAEDPTLRRLDALGRASAAHTMAARMVDDLKEEAEAAVAALDALAAKTRAGE